MKDQISLDQQVAIEKLIQNHGNDSHARKTPIDKSSLTDNRYNENQSWKTNNFTKKLLDHSFTSQDSQDQIFQLPLTLLVNLQHPQRNIT